jgi:hypothetical protein
MKIARCSVLLGLMMAMSFTVPAQSKTTEAIHKAYGGRSFFFYHNTLRMLNQKEDPALDLMIKDLEKMKFLMISKDGQKVDYSKLVSDYKAENFESAMTSRHDGKTFDIFLKGDKKTEGMLVLINDDNNLLVLDIVGSIALDQVTKLYSTLDESSDVGSLMKSFMEDKDEKKKKGETETDH